MKEKKLLASKPLSVEPPPDSRRNGPVAQESSTRFSLQQLIAERAYSLYLARGGRQGDPLADWLEAERQLTAEPTSPQLVEPD